MVYELWDLGSGNCIGYWESEEEALECVRYIRDGGFGVENLALGNLDTLEGIEGEALLERIK